MKYYYTLDGVRSDDTFATKKEAYYDAYDMAASCSGQEELVIYDTDGNAVFSHTFDFQEW